MEKLYRSNSKTLAEADIVIAGVPDESGSHAKRKGTKMAPQVLRAAWNEFEYFERGGKVIPISPMKGTFEGRRIIDLGDYSKSQVAKLAARVAKLGKLPIFIGGDHSITTEALKGLVEPVGKKVSILYFDAHPDFVSSTHDYYGSVLSDSSDALDYARSVLIGTRAAEPEELDNAKNAELMIITPLDLVASGLQGSFSKVARRIGKNKVYVSIDLDCIDPAFAPGVSVPTPCGLSSTELVFLLKKFVSVLDIVGLDIVELSPDYDFNGMTASLSARILSECIASLKQSRKSRKTP